jgi:hypothetical protein
VEVGFVGRVRPAKDSSEVAAGGHAESLDKITRRPVVLLLHKNATAVGQHEGARTYPLGSGGGGRRAWLGLLTALLGRQTQPLRATLSRRQQLRARRSPTLRA